MTAAKPRRPRTVKPPAPASPAGAAAALDPAAVVHAMRSLMEPLAALAIARGVPFAALEDQLKSAFVAAAGAAHPTLPAHRKVSRISTVTGLTRREVARLTQPRPEVAAAPRTSPATRVFTRWLADPALRNAQGEPMALPRQGPAPSFEAVAHSVTRDVHPRSLLDELCRLGLARVDGDFVHAARDRVVPRGDGDRLLGFLGHNVGDHLRAAVANVLAESPPHLEQAVFADELSAQSVETFRQLMRTQWKTLLATTVPALQKLIDADRAAGRAPLQRVRVGLYSYDEPMPAAAGTGAAAAEATAAAPAAATPTTKKAARQPKTT